MITITTRSSSSVKPRCCCLDMGPPALLPERPAARAKDGTEIGLLVLAAGRIGDHHRRAQLDLARGVLRERRGPVVVAPLHEVEEARRAVAQVALMVGDQLAVHVDLREALALNVLLELD